MNVELDERCILQMGGLQYLKVDVFEALSPNVVLLFQNEAAN
jgi:hypothetical protein